MPTFRRYCLLAAIAALSLLGGCDYFVSPQARYEKAQELVEHGDRRRAVIELKNALQKEPDLPGARLLLADVALWLGDAASADAELKRVPVGQEPAKYADLQTRIDIALGRHQQVLDSMTSRGADMSDARRAYYSGMAYYGLKQAVAAEDRFRAAVKADPAMIEAQVGIVEALAARNETTQALESSAALVRDHPDSALAWHVRGSLLARRGQNEEAVKALKRASELAPKQLDTIRQISLLAALTEVQLAMQDLDGARDSSSALTRLAPGSPIALITASRIDMAGNDYVGAAAELRRVVNANPKLSQARFLLGVALLAQNNLEQAASELTTVVRQTPEQVEARQLLAQIRMRQQDPDGALRVLVPALQSSAEDPRLVSLADSARMQAGSSAQTIEMLEEALKNSPNNTGLRLQLASTYLQAGTPEKAVALLRTGQDNQGGTRREALLLQAVAKAQGPAAARKEVDAMVAANPGDAQLLTLAAAFYTYTGDSTAARKLLNGALQRDSKNTALLFALAQLEWSTRQPAAARTALQQLLKVDADHAPARLTLAQMDFAAGDYEAAKAGLEILRQRDGRTPLPRLLLARIALMRNDTAQADLLIDEAVKATPGDADLRNSTGLLYLNSGRFDQAIAQLQAGTKLDPTQPVLWLNLGRAQQALGQAAPARESLSRALALKPDWVVAEGALAFIDLQAGDRAAALARISRLQQKKPRDPAVLILAGEVRSTLRDYTEAAESFTAAAQIQPSGPLAFKIYEARRAGQQSNAIEPLEQWVQQHPEDVTFRNVLADAYTLAGERKRAVEQYERMLAAQPNNVAALNNVAWLYFELKDGRAEATARKANSLAPKSSAVADTLGWILAESGKAGEGLPFLKAAAADAKANPEIRYHYAAALARTGATEDARTELQRLLEEHASFPSRDAAQQLHTRIKAGERVQT